MLYHSEKRPQPLLEWTVFLFAWLGVASIAQAQKFGIGITGSRPALGNVTAGDSGDTVFQVSTSGAITKISGTGARTSTGSSQVTVTVTCGNQNQCNSRTLSGTISSVGSPTGRAGAMTNFDLSGSIISSESGANPRTFTVGAIGKNSSKTFNVGMDFPIKGDDTGGSTGSAQSQFVITLVPNGSGNTVTTTGTGTATVYRSLSITKNSDLAFGKVVRPDSGSSTVTINAATGLRSLTGTAVALPVPSPSRANYTVTGEGGRAVSITVPTSVVMTREGGSETLTVTTTKTVSGTPTLTSIMGMEGSYTFSVGGSLTLTSSTVSGAYSGVFNVSAAYN
ncbi:DUF4402 domain-containing protein [Phenylobacterium sp.]|uniref:DUF4402 domain-containing protein n=1 Tax=Phenylobacterium sp. TaxID=1871053 RepID=UPI003941E8D6